jgi:hypothetical protein
MQSNYRSLTTPLLTCLLLGLPAAAQAQFRRVPTTGGYGGSAAFQQRQSNVAWSGLLPAQKFQSSMNTINPGRNNFNVNPYLNGGNPAAYGYGYGGYPYGGYYGSPVGDYMNGAANVINAQGQFTQQYTQANLTNEQVKQAKIDTQRKKFDEMMYEKANTPTLEQLREQDQALALQRTRNNPPLTEIYAGVSLNNLLLGIQQTETNTGYRGPLVPLDPDILSHINLTGGTTRGSATVFRDAGNLDWPRVLARDPFTRERKQVEKYFAEAYNQMATSKKVKNATLDNLLSSLDDMQAALKGAVAEVSTNDYIKGKRYINELQDAAKMLDDPNAANFFGGKWTPKGNTVGELIQQMTQEGLRFAAAASGDEAAYVALHRAMLNYDAGLSRLAPPPSATASKPN